MPFVRATDGVPLYYRSIGRGRPIVLVHAWTMNGRLSDANAAALAEDHQVVTVDLRGHGRSGKGPVNLTMAQLGADLAMVIEHLDLRDVVLGGWSMGMTATYNYLEQRGTSQPPFHSRRWRPSTTACTRRCSRSRSASTRLCRRSSGPCDAAEADREIG